MVGEEYGAWGAEAMDSLSCLAAHLSNQFQQGKGKGQLSSIAFMAG